MKYAVIVEIRDVEGKKMFHWIHAGIWVFIFIITMICGADRWSAGWAMLLAILYNICFALGI